MIKPHEVVNGMLHQNLRSYVGREFRHTADSNGLVNNTLCRWIDPVVVVAWNELEKAACTLAPIHHAQHPIVSLGKTCLLPSLMRRINRPTTRMMSAVVNAGVVDFLVTSKRSTVFSIQTFGWIKDVPFSHSLSKEHPLYCTSSS